MWEIEDTEISNSCRKFLTDVAFGLDFSKTSNKVLVIQFFFKPPKKVEFKTKI